MEVADEDGGRAVGRDAALASPAVLAGGGVAAVPAGIGLENIMEVIRACVCTCSCKIELGHIAARDVQASFG